MRVIFIFFSALVLILSCKKNKTAAPDPNAKTFIFNSLTSDLSTMKQGDVTNVKANVTGSVSYKWSSNAGDLFGSGATVLFGAGSCCTGGHTITCTVSDTHGNSESKTVCVNVTLH